MIINSTNKKIINDLYVHDSNFDGLIYDYKLRYVKVTFDNCFTRKKINMTFYNAILFNMQSCCFWHSGNSVYDISVEDNSLRLNELVKLQKDNSELFEGSYLDRNISYIIIKIVINSGDELLIICENIEYIEEMY